MLDRTTLSKKIGNCLLTLIQGDITQQGTVAIVNAANSSLLGGGGVDGAIHRAGGPSIVEECKAIRKEQGDCPTGEAVVTNAGNLKTRFVIHTVGPMWQGGFSNEDDLLRNAYWNSLQKAVEKKATTIAFPSISTGAYGFPIERASKIALATVAEFIRTYPHLREVRFVVFSKPDFEVYALLFKDGA